MTQDIQNKHFSNYPKTKSSSRASSYSSNYANDSGIIILEIDEDGERGDLIAIDNLGKGYIPDLTLAESLNIRGIAEEEFYAGGIVFVRISGIYQDEEADYTIDSPIVYRESGISQIEITKANITATEEIYIKLGQIISTTKFTVDILIHGWII